MKLVRTFKMMQQKYHSANNFPHLSGTGIEVAAVFQKGETRENE